MPISDSAPLLETEPTALVPTTRWRMPSDANALATADADVATATAFADSATVPLLLAMADALPVAFANW